MKKWLRRIRGAVVMGLTWAVVWAPVGVLIGLIVDPDGSMDEMWWMVGALPGLLGGAVFATVLGIVGRRRRFDELSLPRFAAWGAVAGLLVGTLPFTLGNARSDVPLWLLAGVLIGSITIMSASSAAASLAIARMAERRELVDAGAAGGLTTLRDRESAAQPLRATDSTLSAAARAADSAAPRGSRT